MNIVFDVGNVLIRWRPEKAVEAAFPEREAALAYLESVGFYDWNYAQDGGRGFAEGFALLEATHPGRVAPLAVYPERFGATIREPIAGSWDLVGRLGTAGHRLFAITNFAAYTWPVALELHPRLGTDFEDVVVSGVEGVLKPGPEIYRLFLARNGLQAAECFFIDDSPANVEGARAVGMVAHHFTAPETLAADLAARGLL